MYNFLVWLGYYRVVIILLIGAIIWLSIPVAYFSFRAVKRLVMPLLGLRPSVNWSVELSAGQGYKGKLLWRPEAKSSVKSGKATPPPVKSGTNKKEAAGQ
jgi:hypothetical protein